MSRRPLHRLRRVSVLFVGFTALFGTVVVALGSLLTMTGSGGIDNNVATADGGGIYNDDTANLTETTIQANRAGSGGGIFPLGSANRVATNCPGNSVGNC